MEPDSCPTTSVKVIGIISIVLGSLICLCMPCGALSPVFNQVMMDNPGLDAAARHDMQVMMAAQPHVAVTYTLLFFWLILSVMLLASGIGTLKLKSWAPMLAMAWAVGAMLMVCVGTAMTILTFRHMGQLHNPGGRIGMLLAPLGSLFWLIYPIVVLMFYSRASVRNQFRHQANAPLPV